MMPNKINLWLATLLMATLCACAQMGIAPADTFAKKEAVWYATSKTVAQMADTLLIDGSISPKEAQSIHDALDTAIEGLDAAKLLAKTDMLKAENRLRGAIIVLTELQSRIATRQIATGAKP